jgi:hypothetical protein
MPEPLDTRYRLRETRLDGERALVLDTEIPDSAPETIKEGLARRAAVNAAGVCPCGARAVLPNRATRRQAARSGAMLQVTVEHENDCPALLRGWRMLDLGRSE